MSVNETRQIRFGFLDDIPPLRSISPLFDRSPRTSRVRSSAQVGAAYFGRTAHSHRCRAVCRLLLGLLAVAGSPSIRPVAKAETHKPAQLLGKPFIYIYIGFLAVGTNIYEPLMCTQQLSIFCAVSAYMYRSCFITSKPALLAQMSAMLVLVTYIRLLSPENVVYQTAHWLATSAPGS